MPPPPRPAPLMRRKGLLRAALLRTSRTLLNMRRRRQKRRLFGWQVSKVQEQKYLSSFTGAMQKDEAKREKRKPKNMFPLLCRGVKIAAMRQRHFWALRITAT